MSTKKSQNPFVQGAISPNFIADSIAAHQAKISIGGHSIFLGQVRADQTTSGQTVASISYTAYEEMATAEITRIREEVFGKHPITCMHIHHSLGRVLVGEICLFVFTSATHRKEAIEACSEIVERIKREVPIWGQEELSDQSYLWKENR
ncbi:MAG: molybdenum cofactor biosynthesis protein MoaE [Sphingobacteriales bacterium]|nr:molybdenum cofactor biosynthesis protein MoaE [Sphingobacteriales bacterium]